MFHYENFHQEVNLHKKTIAILPGTFADIITTKNTPRPF